MPDLGGLGVFGPGRRLKTGFPLPIDWRNSASNAGSSAGSPSIKSTTSSGV